MIDLSVELLTVSAKLPLWQQDALRRICTGKIAQADHAALVLLAKAAAGLVALGAPVPVPLAAAHLGRTHAAGGGTVLLKALHSVSSVNALAPAQQLDFGTQGVTAIYGENGTGKSGYSRILRRACRARRAPAILPDVVAGKPATPPKAKFSVQVGGAPQELAWEDGKPSPDALAQFAVFDRECERSFIDEAGETCFTPPDLARFEELAQVVGRVKKELEEEDVRTRPKDTLADLAPKVSHHKQAADLLGMIRGSLKDSDYDLLADKLAALAWGPEQQERLSACQRQLLEADPAQAAKGLRALASTVKGYRSKVVELEAPLGAAGLEALRMEHAAARAAREAAEQVRAGQVLGGGGARGLGGEVWQALFAAATRFAAASDGEIARFPAGETCPLCLQALDGEAKLRLARFSAFMEEDTRKQAEQSAAALAQRVSALKRLTPPALDEATRAQLVALLRAEAVGAVGGGELGAQIAAARDAAVAAAAKPEWAPPTPGFPAGLDRICEGLVAAIESKAVAADALAAPAARGAVEAKAAALASLKVAVEQRARISAVIEAHRTAAALQRAASSFSTRAISVEGKEVAERVVLAELSAAFTAELKALGAEGLVDTRIAPKADKGKTNFLLALPNSGRGGWRASGVLSEGEQRVIALAYFFAEASLAPTPVGLILDDPVSSLDHRWAERIAKRLTTLAKERQVVVFTHSIAFLIELDRCGTEDAVPVTRRYVTKGAEGPGRCTADAGPWERLDVKTRVKVLNDELTTLRGEHAKDSRGRAYTRGAAQLCSDLRSAWERAVEELVFGTAVERFGYAVSTGRLVRAVCTNETFRQVHVAMTRLSAIVEAHDKARGAFAGCPGPDEIEGFIKDLQAFVKYQKEEAKRAEAEREPLQQPPVPGQDPAGRSGGMGQRSA